MIGTVITTCFSKPHHDDSHFNSSLLRFSKVMAEDNYYVCVSNISWTTSYIVWPSQRESNFATTSITRFAANNDFGGLYSYSTRWSIGYSYMPLLLLETLQTLLHNSTHVVNILQYRDTIKIMILFFNEINRIRKTPVALLSNLLIRTTCKSTQHVAAGYRNGKMVNN